MGIFDFLKSKTREKRAKKTKKDKIKKPDFTEIEEQEKNLPEKIDFSEIESFIEKKNNVIRKKENLYLDYLKKKKQEFLDNAENQLEVLRNVDLEHKKAKADDRVKEIVRQNRDKYIQHLEAAIEKLKNIDEQGLEDFINKANKIFSEFHSKSSVNYQKATVLMGEIGEIRKLIKSFSQELIKSFNENRTLINEIKILSNIKSKIKETGEIKEKIEQNKKEIESIEEKVSDKKKEKEQIKKEIEEIKNTSEYKENLEKQEKKSKTEREIEKLIIDLKQKIDFKELANFFHIFPEKIKTVKKHKEDFSKEFKENRKEIIDLLEEAGLKNKEFSDTLKKIQNKEESLEELKKGIKKDKTLEHYDKIKNIDSEIDSFENSKQEKQKRNKTLESEKQNLFNNIKSDLNKTGVELKEQLS